MYRQNYPDDPGMHNNHGNSHTRVEYRANASFCERIQKSLVAFIAGLVLLSAAIGLLYFNEGRAVQTAQSLDEGLRIVIPLKTPDVAFESNNGKLVHLSAPLFTEKVLSDVDYGIRIHAVKLKRQVQLFQWVEHASKREYDEGGQTRIETTYSYSLEWKEEIIPSTSFDNSVGHDNPRTMPVQAKEFVAETVQVGNFHLSKNLINRVKDFKPLGTEFLNPPSRPGISIYMGAVYHSLNPHQPQVGDVRVMFQYAGVSGKSALGEPDKVSVVAKQSGTQLTRYETDAGDDLELLYYGELSAQNIFENQQNDNTLMTWAFRFGGWLLMFVGFGCLTSIVTTLVDWIPIVRELVAMGVGVMNTALSICLSITVIAIAWIRYRPMLGFTLLGISLLPLLISKLKARQSNTNYSRNVYS